MADSPLIIKSKAFALEVIQVCKQLRVAKCESALINQFLRSGTSIGANIREAFYAHGKADFIAKLQIALKECSETEYWVELILESGIYFKLCLLHVKKRFADYRNDRWQRISKSFRQRIISY